MANKAYKGAHIISNHRLNPDVKSPFGTPPLRNSAPGAGRVPVHFRGVGKFELHEGS
jgi:hypothetical protein